MAVWEIHVVLCGLCLCFPKLSLSEIHLFFFFLLDIDFSLLRLNGAEIGIPVFNHILHGVVCRFSLCSGCLTGSVHLMTNFS